MLKRKAMLQKLESIVDAINDQLDNQIKLDDIPDEAFTEEQLELIYLSNISLYDSLRYRNRIFSMIKKEIEKQMEKDNE